MVTCLSAAMCLQYCKRHMTSCSSRHIQTTLIVTYNCMSLVHHKPIGRGRGLKARTPSRNLSIAINILTGYANITHTHINIYSPSFIILSVAVQCQNHAP